MVVAHPLKKGQRKAAGEFQREMGQLRLQLTRLEWAYMTFLTSVVEDENLPQTRKGWSLDDNGRHLISEVPDPPPAPPETPAAPAPASLEAEVSDAPPAEADTNKTSEV